MKPKVTIVESAHAAPCLEMVEAAGFEVVETNPDFVISHGGDGTVLRAEFGWPGVPKIILKSSKVCKLCSTLSNEQVLAKVIAGDYEVKKFWKLEATCGGDKLVALNDITIHNKDSRHGIRYELGLDGALVGKEIIGDGLVVATPFGSTGYYRSITGSTFELGIGVAYNNSTEQADHMVVGEEREIKFKLNRGEALLYADNQEHFLELSAGAEVIIKKINTLAQIVNVVV